MDDEKTDTIQFAKTSTYFPNPVKDNSQTIGKKYCIVLYTTRLLFEFGINPVRKIENKNEQNKPVQGYVYKHKL